MLGVVGSQQQEAADQSCSLMVGQVLAQALRRETHLLVLTEVSGTPFPPPVCLSLLPFHPSLAWQVFNAVMDVFSDDRVHPSFEAAGLFPALKHALPRVGGPVPASHLA